MNRAMDYSESPRTFQSESSLSENGIQPETHSDFAWYCTRTKLRHERIAAANLRRLHGFEVFNPQLRIQRTTIRGVVRVIEPLFPCYLFVRCSLGESYAKIRYINGVSSFLHFGNKIPSVHDSVIEELRACFGTDESISCDDTLTRGASVTVVSGAFSGMNASVLRVLHSGQRVQILLEVLGRSTSVEVDRSFLVMENYSMADSLPSLSVSGK